MANTDSKRKKELQSTIDVSDARVDDYFRKNPMTGDPFKDIGGLLATREDRNRSSQARKYMDEEAGREVTTRGQDIQFELGRGEIGVNTERNRINEKGIDVQKELGLGELEVNRDRNRVTEKGIDKQFDLGQGELGLNKDIFDQTVKRYNEVGRPADLFNLTEKAAGVKVGAAESGLELSDSLVAETEKYFRGGPAKKTAAPVDESGIYFDKVLPQFPDKITGIPTLAPESSGVSPIFQAANLGVMAGKAINRLATPPRSSIRRKVRKVN